MHDREYWLKVLALGPDATKKQIDLAYRDLVKVWHPDRFESDPALRLKAEEKLRELNDAYDALRRPRIFQRFTARAQRPPTPSSEGQTTSQTRSSRFGDLRMFGAVLVANAAIVGILLSFGMRRSTITPTDTAPVTDPQLETAQPRDPRKSATDPILPTPRARAVDPTTPPRDAQASGTDPAIPTRPAQAVDPLPAVPQATNPPAPTSGALTVISQPIGATVYVNDAPVGRTPLTLAAIVPGAYRVRVELNGYSAWSSSVRIEAGASEKLIAFIEKRGPQ
jgi:PEGA domain/DnaJ domain